MEETSGGAVFSVTARGEVGIGEGRLLDLEGMGFHTFMVNSAYFQVRKDRVGEVSSVYSKLWRCKALPSALVTAWRVMENKIATRVNLERRGVVVENLVCGLCGKVEELSLIHI